MCREDWLSKKSFYLLKFLERLMKKKSPPPDMGLIGIGIALIFIGFLVVMIGMLMQSFGGEGASKDTNAKFSFGGFIGPFPFGFGNDKQWVMISLIIAMSLFFLMMWLFRGVR